ncbi:MAG: phenylacetate--CoA ligase family protein [Chlamydiota bacterium]
MNGRNTVVALYYALSDMKNGRGRIRAYRHLSRAQWASPAEITERQGDRLRLLLSRAVSRVPYYRETARENGLMPDAAEIRDELKKFPLLTKEILRTRSDDLLDPDPAPGWYPTTSGGSTGEPVRFVQDAVYEDWDWAVTALMYGWAERRFGEPLVKLWGSEKDIAGAEGDRVSRRIARIESVSLLNSFLMSDERMRAYAGAINRLKPVLIEAYAQSIAEFARYIAREKMEIHSPRGIISTAGVLLPGQRETVESMFRCRVFNRYGSREAGNIACECGAHRGLHVDALGKYVEILDDRGEECAPGEAGRVVVTVLTNFTMPLIRYEIGDLAVKAAGACPCGRGLPLLERVSGRVVDLFRNAAGTRVDGEYFTHLFYGLECVERFQVIQRAIDRIEIRVVLRGGGGRAAWEQAFPSLAVGIRRVMGEGCVVRCEIVDRIEPSKSGKHRYTICELPDAD